MVQNPTRLSDMKLHRCDVCPAAALDPHQIGVLRQSLHLAYEFNISGRSQNKMLYGYITACFISIPTTISGW